MEPASLPDAQALAALQKRLNLERRFRSGVDWFFWIAGLSLINTIVFVLGGSMTFVVGLGLTQVVDAIGYVITQETSGTTTTVIRAVAFVISLGISGIFVLFGVLGRRRKRWAVITGMVLYLLDGLIFLAFADFLPALFHAIALFGLWSGLSALRELIKLDQPLTPPTIEPV